MNGFERTFKPPTLLPCSKWRILHRAKGFERKDICQPFYVISMKLHDATSQLQSFWRQFFRAWHFILSTPVFPSHLLHIAAHGKRWEKLRYVKDDLCQATGQLTNIDDRVSTCVFLTHEATDEAARHFAGE